LGSFAGVCKVNGVDVDTQASFAGIRGSFANLSRKRVLFCRWTEYVSACMHRSTHGKGCGYAFTWLVCEYVGLFYRWKEYVPAFMHR